MRCSWGNTTCSRPRWQPFPCTRPSPHSPHTTEGQRFVSLINRRFTLCMRCVDKTQSSWQLSQAEMYSHPPPLSPCSLSLPQPLLLSRLLRCDVKAGGFDYISVADLWLCVPLLLPLPLPLSPPLPLQFSLIKRALQVGVASAWSHNHAVNQSVCPSIRLPFAHSKNQSRQQTEPLLS